MGFAYSLKFPINGSESKDITHGSLVLTTTWDGNTSSLTYDDIPPPSQALTDDDGSQYVQAPQRFRTDEGINNHAEFRWVDDAGLESKNPSTFDFVLTDTTNPSDPAGIMLAADVVEIDKDGNPI